MIKGSEKGYVIKNLVGNCELLTSKILSLDIENKKLEGTVTIICSPSARIRMYNYSTSDSTAMSVKIVVSVTEIADMSSKDRYVIEGVGKSVSKMITIIFIKYSFNNINCLNRLCVL